MKVLVAEDDRNIRRGVVDLLRREGYQPLPAEDGRRAIEVFAAEAPDFVILDVMMPELSGYDVCREIRRRDSQVPVLFLTAKAEEVDKVIGLELGADDYVAKPFGVRELVARIRAISRRCLAARPDGPTPFELGDLRVSPAELRAWRGEASIELSLREVRLLDVFARNPGVVLDRNRLFDECWGYDYAPNSRTLDQHMAKLRKKVEVDPKQPTLLKTVHGVGYRYDP